LQNVTIVVLFFTTALVLLGSLPFIDARHSDEGYSTGVTPGTNQLFYRDSTNMSPQTATLELFVNNQKVEITVVEADSDLDPNSIDSVLVGITQNGLNQAVIAMETDIHTGIFTEMLTLGVGLFSATYEPEHQGVGRFSAILRGINQPRTVAFSDYSIDDPDGLGSRVSEACPWDLVTHPVQLQLSPGLTANEITVTISYANAVLGIHNVNDLKLLYRFSNPISGFRDLGAVHNPAAKTYSVTTPPLKTFVFGQIIETVSGQYALGVKIDNCIGGGGGGLVRPEMKINAIGQITVPVGGELIPVDNVSLLLAYGLVNSWWIAPIGIGISVGIYLVKRRF